MPEPARRQARLDAGLCTSCGTEPAAEGRTRCEACLEAARAYAADRRETARDLGLCEACLHSDAVPGRGGRCSECADRYTAAQLVRERARRRKAKE